MLCLIYRMLRVRARRSSTSPSARSRGSLLAHHLADIAQSGGSLAAIQCHAKATVDEVGRAHVHDETRWLADIPGNNVVDRLRCKIKNEYDIDMEPYYVKVPLTMPGKLRQRDVYIPTMPIHEMVAVIGKLGMQAAALGCEGDVEAWFTRAWEHREFQDFPHRGVPILLFNDGVGIHRNSEYEVLSWRSLLVHGGHTLEIHFPVLVVPTSCIDKRTFYDRVGRYAGWMGRVLSANMWPQLKFEGEILSEIVSSPTSGTANSRTTAHDTLHRRHPQRLQGAGGFAWFL